MASWIGMPKVVWQVGLGLVVLCTGSPFVFQSSTVPGQAAPPSVARQSPSATAAEHISNAHRALEANDLARAKAELEQALKENPKSAEAYFILGLVELQSGETQQAIERYQGGLRLDPNSYSGRYNLALAYLRARNLEAGARELERAEALDPKQADAAYNLGVVLLELGRPGAALPHLRSARRLSPTRPDAAFNLVRAELAANRPSDAWRDAQQAAESFGGDAAWDISIGQLFLDSQQPRDAATYLGEALRLSPNQPDVRRRLATAYLQLNDPDRVLATIPAATTAEEHALRSRAYTLSHQFERADEEAKLALEQDPDNPRILLDRARLLQHLGRHDAALELLKKGITLAPESPDLYYSAAVSDYFERRYSEARQNLKIALQYDPKSARAAFLYAAASINQGNTREGEEYLRRALALEPRNARFFYHLGALFVRVNNASAAEQAFRKAIELKPDYAVPHYQLGRLLAPAHPEAAAAELEAAARYDPQLAAAYYQLARVYNRLGETAKSKNAMAAFQRLKQQEVDEAQELGRDITSESDALTSRH